MGCQRSKCIVCNGPYKACQLVDGMCNTCFMAAQPQVPNEAVNSLEISAAQLIEQNITDNNVYYS